MDIFNKQLLLESQDNPELFNLLLPNSETFWDNYDLERTEIIQSEIIYLCDNYQSDKILRSVGCNYYNYITIDYLLHPKQIKNKISKNEYFKWLYEIKNKISKN